MTRYNLTTLTAVAALLVHAQASAVTTLTFGSGAASLDLLPNTPGQSVDLFLSATPSQLTGGANLVFSVAPGGPAVEYTSPLTDTLYTGGALLPDTDTSPQGLNIGLLSPLPVTTTINATGTQKLGTLTFDTTGVSSGTYALDFTGTSLLDQSGGSIGFTQLGGASVSVPSPPLNVHTDLTFDDNQLPSPFSVAAGSPSFSNGRLVLNGNTLLTASTATVYGGTAPADNYVFEFLATPSSIGDAFDIIGAINNADQNANSALFLFRQDLGGGDTYNGIEGSEQAFATSITPVVGTEVAIAYVVNNGTAEVYIDGVLEVTAQLDESGPTPIDLAGLQTVSIGGNLFDTLRSGLGGFNGTINRARFSTFTAGDFNPENLLSVFTPAPADLDLDGDVDDADFALFFAAFSGPGVPTGNPAADLDGDTDTDDADFGLAFAAFTGPGGAASVPEPTSLALLGLGGLMIARRRRVYV